MLAFPPPGGHGSLAGPSRVSSNQVEPWLLHEFDFYAALECPQWVESGHKPLMSTLGGGH
jgi:hypothetical protein